MQRKTYIWKVRLSLFSVCRALSRSMTRKVTHWVISPKSRKRSLKDSPAYFRKSLTRGDWRMRWRRIRSSDGHFWLVAITACMAKRGESNPIRALSGNGVGNTIFRRHRRKVLLRCGNSWIVHSRISRSICKALLSLGLSMICMTVGGMLVKYPEIWKDAGWNDGDSNMFIRVTDKNIYLLQKGNMHGSHHELRTLYKYYSLLQEPLNIPSGFTMKPEPVTEDEEEPYFQLYNDSLQYRVHYYSDDQERPWRIELRRSDNKKVLTAGMVKWAEDHGFKRHGDGPQLYMEQLVSDGALKDRLQEWINATPVE